MHTKIIIEKTNKKRKKNNQEFQESFDVITLRSYYILKIKIEDRGYGYWSYDIYVFCARAKLLYVNDSIALKYLHLYQYVHLLSGKLNSHLSSYQVVFKWKSKLNLIKTKTTFISWKETFYFRERKKEGTDQGM